MDVKRRIIIQAIKTNDNELIPLWDERVTFEKTEDCGNGIRVKDIRGFFFNTVECMYDLKTRTVEAGIELDVYPDEKDLEFKVEEAILFEKSSQVLTEAKIEKIVYEEYDMVIVRGRKVDKRDIERVKGIEIDNDALYAIKRWKPFYILDNGSKIEWVHQLYHKADEVVK